MQLVLLPYVRYVDFKVSASPLRIHPPPLKDPHTLHSTNSIVSPSLIKAKSAHTRIPPRIPSPPTPFLEGSHSCKVPYRVPGRRVGACFGIHQWYGVSRRQICFRSCKEVGSCWRPRYIGFKSCVFYFHCRESSFVSRET